MRRGDRLGRFGIGFLMKVAILRMLEKEPLHGYDIARRLEELSPVFNFPSPAYFGSLYRVLMDMEVKGFIIEDKDAVVEDERRRVFMITEDGRAWLKTALESLQTYKELIDNLVGGV